jgi:DHA1 family tetracycline resistance protein-like MFS transporter
VAKMHALIFVTLTLFIDTVAFGLIMPTLPGFLEELTGRSHSENAVIVGYLVASFALLQFLFAPLIRNLSDRFGRKPVLLVSLFTLGINHLICGFATTLWVPSWGAC